MAIDIRGLGPKIASLREMSPGKVSVSATSEIGFVQALNRVTETLNDDQRATLAETMTYLAGELSGLEGLVSAHDQGKRSSTNRWWRSLSIGGMASKEEIARAQHNAMLAASGAVPKASDAPRGLLKAAEAWLVSEMGGNVSEADAQLLKGPWDGAFVER
jgi:hypothetical protein